MKPTRFLMFGCWNKGECSEYGINPLSTTLRQLGDYVKENHTDFIVISGDNYYPDKIKDINGTKKHSINLSNLKSGFECLPNNIDIDIILGNHDLESSNGQKIMEEETSVSNIIDPCIIINKEIEITKTKQNMKLQLYGMRIINDKTMIIEFDTTFYDEVLQENTCYLQMRKTDRFLRNSSNKIKKRQEKVIRKWIKEAKNKNIKNLIFIGHHPLVSHKMKVNNNIEKIKTTHQIGLINFISSLELNNDMKYYYLCSDVHFYQKSIVNINKLSFLQYVVGTGGTTLDTIPKDSNDKIIVNSDNHSISIEKIISKQKHGFLIVDIDIENEINLYFKENIMEGGMKKIKRKNKSYKKIKNKLKNRSYKKK
jgi:hypothetical protein